MKIRGNTVGTPIKPERNLVKATDLNEAEKKQARQNIGAVRGTKDAVSFEGWNGTGMYMSAYPEYNLMEFGDDHDQPITLRNISDGEQDNDAATVGQVKAVDLTTKKTLTVDQSNQVRENIHAPYGSKLNVFLAAEDGTDVSMTALGNHVLEFGGNDDTPITLTNIAHSFGDNDAATVGVVEAKMDEVCEYVGDNCVYYTQQPAELTEQQKATARQNIGALSGDEVQEMIDESLGNIEIPTATGEWELLEDITISEPVVAVSFDVEKMNTKKEVHIEGYINTTDKTITNQAISLHTGTPVFQCNINCKASSTTFMIVDIYKSPRGKTIYDGTMSIYDFTVSGGMAKVSKMDKDLTEGDYSKLIDSKSLALRISETNPIAAGTRIKIWGR